MELFAAGFNAWNQLSFDEPAPSIHPEDHEPRDLHGFRRVLEGQDIERPIARLSYTIVRRDGAPLVAGFLHDKDPTSLEFLSSSAESATGEILLLDKASGGLCTYSSFASWKSGDPARPLLCDVPAAQIAAYDTGFAIRHRDGTVSTFGDDRFSSSLGRDPSPLHPAHSPSPVPDLTTLIDPVSHITAGGLSLAALTSSGTIYAWGSPSTGTHRRRQPLPCAHLTSVPNYLPIHGDDDVDMRDVALGESHAIALTADGRVYVVGDNGNGQLGLGGGGSGGVSSMSGGSSSDGGGGGAGADVQTGRVDEWTRVPFEARPGWEVVGVAAGLRASFIITSKVKTGMS